MRTAYVDKKNGDLEMRHCEIRREAYFEDIFNAITGQLFSAKYCVKICVAWITADRLGNILAQIKNRGVSIEIIYDDSRSNLPILDFDGKIGTVYPIKNRHGAYMHNKFCIIDDEVLITGSFNLTSNADISLENALMIQGDYRLIKSYLHEFEDLKYYSESRSLPRPIIPKHEDGSRCNSLTYKIGVFGYPDGTNGKQKITIWNVCNAHRSAHAWKTIEVDSNSTEDDDFNHRSHDEWYESRETMLEQFKLEREIMDAPRELFSREMDLQVQAYGFIREIQRSFKYGANDDTDYYLHLDWRHMYWRKIIPSQLFYDDGEIYKIIQTHRPGSLSSFYLQEKPW